MHRVSVFILILLLAVHFPGLAAIPLPPQIQSSYSQIVKAAAPSVVSISTSKAINLPNSLFGNDPFFNFFFGGSPNLGGGNNGGSPSLGESPDKIFAKSLGSGVIVDPTGIVVTCGHVIQNARKILVTLSDNREFEGEVIVRDKQNDLAAIQLKGVPPASSLPSIPLETNDVEVGDFLLAIGNPFGVGQTVTSGIVSAIARNVRGRMLIQTDAPINPGNSGGALVSMNGNLIGIPNAILSKTGASHGIGFAIPQAIIRTLLESIPNGGDIIRPWAGITVQRLTSDMAKSLNILIPQGVLISALHEGSPALAAGLVTGDVITSLNGQIISNPEEFIYRIQSVPVGQNMLVTILRNGQIQQVTFQPIIPPAIPAPNQQIIPESGDLLKGLEVANLSPALVSKYQLPFGTPEKGVVITNVGNNIIAMRLQLNPGDIIEQINHQPVTSVEVLLTLLPNLQKEESIMIRQPDRRLVVKKNS